MEAVMLTTLPPLFCASICFTPLRDVDEAVQIRGRKRPEVLRRVVGEGLREEDARVVHQRIDRAEALHRGRDDLLGGRGQTDIAVDQREIVRALQLVLLADVARVGYDVVAAIEEQVGHRGADALRCARHDDGLAFRGHVKSPVFEVSVSVEVDHCRGAASVD